MQEVFIINQNLIDDFVDKINGKEEKNNKVTSISSESTDIEYPSAKAVYDKFDALNEGQIDIATAPYNQLGGSTSSHLADLLHKIDNNFGDTLFCSVAVSGTADAFIINQTGGLQNLTSNHSFFLLAYNNVADSNSNATIEIYYNNAVSPATIVNTRMGNSAPCAWKKGEWGIFFVNNGRAQLLGSFSDTEYYQGVEFIKSTNTQSSDNSLTGVTNKLNDIKDGTILFYQLPDLKFTATSPIITLTLRNGITKAGPLKENDDYKFLNQLSPNSILILQYSYSNNSPVYNIIGTVESSKYTDEKDLKLSYILDTIFSNRVFVVDEVKEESKRVQYFFDAEGDSYATNEILYIYVPRYEVTTDGKVTLAWRKINGMPQGSYIKDLGTGTNLSGNDVSGYWLKIQWSSSSIGWALLDKTLSPVEATTDHAGLLSTADKTKLNSFDEKEDKTNKVTSISSSNTNTQYPSAKATYDAINNIVNNIPSKTSDLTNDSGFLTSHQSLTDYVQKSATSGLLKNDGTVDTTNYLTSHQDITGKEDKSNKVTSWSNPTTDTNYPSEKLVKDTLSGYIPTSKTLTPYTSLNDYGETGFYVQDGFVSAYSDRPSGASSSMYAYFSLLVEKSSINCKQIYTDYDGHNSYVRYYEGNRDYWTNWSLITPTKTSDLTNDSGFLTSHQDISGKADINHTHQEYIEKNVLYEHDMLSDDNQWQTYNCTVNYSNNGCTVVRIDNEEPSYYSLNPEIIPVEMNNDDKFIFYFTLVDMAQPNSGVLSVGNVWFSVYDNSFVISEQMSDKIDMTQILPSIEDYTWKVILEPREAKVYYIYDGDEYFVGSFNNYGMAWISIEQIRGTVTFKDVKIYGKLVYVRESDIVDNLDNNDSTKPLSANQGHLLNTRKEDKSNKVTTLSSLSTDAQYPSAKAVFNYLGNTLTDYVQKNATSGLLKNDGTVDTTSYLTSHQDISGKADIQHTHTRDDINEIYDNAENNFKVDFVDISREQVYFSDYIYIYNTTNYNIATDNITDIFYVTLNMSDLNGYQDNYPVAISITNPSSDFNITGMVTPYDKNNPIPVGAQIPSVNPVAHSALNGCKNIHFRVTRAQSRYMSSPTYDYVFEVIDKFSPIINNLTSTNGNLALSAKQGKVLSDMIGDAIQYINE